MLALTAGPGCEAPKRADVPPDPRLRQVEDELAESLRALDAERAAGDALRRAEAEIKAKADEVEALEKKLGEVVGTVGDVTTEDGAVRVELVDKILFPVGEAELTPGGREVLARVGAALKEIEDKQIWVQGHTDDSPIVVRKPKPTAPAPEAVDPKHKKGGKQETKVAKDGESPATNDAAKNRRIEIVLYPRAKISPK
jgi:chemotaxis protein MotB